MTFEGVKDIILNIVFFGVFILGIGFVVTMLIGHITRKVHFKRDLVAIFGLLLTSGMTALILYTFNIAPTVTAMGFILMGFGIFLTINELTRCESNHQ